MKTEEFVERLALSVSPVRPLRTPWMRAALWSLATGLYFGVLTLLMTSRDDLALNAAEPLFTLQQLTAIATSLSAAAASFVSVVPGYSNRRVLLLPATAATAWLGSVVVGSPHAWNDMGLARLLLEREWPCVAVILLGSVLPASGLLFMLRRGAPLTPRLTAALGVFASAGLAHVVACVAEPHANNLTVLVWHGGTVLGLAGIAAAVGPSVLKWRTTLSAS
jgi:hypothetical protein